MKNLFKIHPFTYFICLTILLSGYFNYFLIISIILIIHDLGHIMLIKLFKYKIKEVEILPFGSHINTNISPNSKTLELFFISLAGIVFQLLLFPLIYSLNGVIINHISYNIFLKYNRLLIIFNLLPIIPLDGSKILQSILENFFSYKKVLVIINIISIIGIIIFIIYQTLYSLNAYLILGFLGYKTYELIKNTGYLFNQFILSRYLDVRKNRKVKYVKELKEIYKNRYNFINGKSEEKVISNLFNSQI